MSAQAPPIDPSIATWNHDALQLFGGRCGNCETVTFPRLDGCPRCGSDDIAETLLSRTGTLWTWTTQGFLPKRPFLGAGLGEDFSPYLLGYVELPEGVMIEGWLVDVDVESVRIGQAMELTEMLLHSSEPGETVRTFSFRPAAGEAR